MSDNHSHVNTSNPKRLVIALAITSTFFIAEVIGGFVYGSLALLSDAAHMFTDVVALVIALLAIKMGAKAADDRRTFGYRRFEILAAAFNAVLLFGVALYVLVEAVQRFVKPEAIQSTGMLIVAVLGLLANLVSMRILAGGQDKSLNVKGAYLEVWADMLGSLGVIGGAIVIQLTGWLWVDPLIAVGIGLWVLPRTWILLRDTTQILLEGTPQGIVLGDLRKAIAAVPGVSGVHDLHVWVSGADEPSCSVHLELAGEADSDTVRQAVTEKISKEHGIHHITVQTEHAPCEDRDELHS